MSGKLVRFGVAMAEELLRSFDRLVDRRGYENRSEALRALVREALVEDSWQDARRTLYGTITLTYNHHVRGLNTKLLAIQHGFPGAIISTLHVHADTHTCMEVLIVRDRPARIKALRDALASTRGVDFARVSLATPETGHE